MEREMMIEKRCAGCSEIIKLIKILSLLSEEDFKKYKALAEVEGIEFDADSIEKAKMFK